MRTTMLTSVLPLGTLEREGFLARQQAESALGIAMEEKNDVRSPFSVEPLSYERGSVPIIHWLEHGKAFEALWRSHNGTPPAARVVVTDGKMTADEAYGLACQGSALLWRGDFQEARQMLSALGNRADSAQRRSRTPIAATSIVDSVAGPAEAF